MAQQRATVAVGIVFLILSWITVPLRLYVRTHLKKVFGVDDILAIISLLMVSVTLLVIVVDPQCQFAAINPIVAPRLQTTLMCFFVVDLLYIVSSGIIKASFSVTLLRIVVRRPHIYYLYFLLAITVIITPVFSLWVVFSCRPIAYFWERATDLNGGDCISYQAQAFGLYAQSALFLFIDFSLAVLPIFIVRDLQMDRRTKVSVVAIFAIGSLASVATIGRLAYIHYFSAFETTLKANQQITIWSMIELGTGLVATSATTLRPLASRVWHGMGVSVNSHHTASSDIQHTSYSTTRGMRPSSANRSFERSSSTQLITFHVTKPIEQEHSQNSLQEQ